MAREAWRGLALATSATLKEIKKQYRPAPSKIKIL